MNKPEIFVRDGVASESSRIGVLIVNLGTPDATDPGSVRRYLREFLSDSRVIENQGLVWKFILNAIILTRRPRAKGLDYEKIWNRDKNESPLKTITRAQAAKLRTAVEQGAVPPAIPGIVVDWAMRYGNPSLESRLEALVKLGCERILLVPLYPQYAAATTAMRRRRTVISSDPARQGACSSTQGPHPAMLRGMRHQRHDHQA